MKRIEMLELALLVFLCVIAIIINSMVGMFTVVIIVLLAMVTMSMGIDPFDLWPSLNKVKFIPGRLIQHPDGRLTLWMDGQDKGNVFVSREAVLFEQKAVNNIKEEAKLEGAKAGILVGSFITGVVLIGGYATWRKVCQKKQGGSKR